MARKGPPYRARSKRRKRTATQTRGTTERVLTAAKQFLLYCALVMGVLLSKAVRSFDSDKPEMLTITLTSVLAAAFIGLIVAPLIFRELKMTRDSSFLAQLGIFAMQGISWQVFITEFASKALQR